MQKNSLLLLPTVLFICIAQACSNNAGKKQKDSTDSARAVNEERKPVDKKSADFAVKAAVAGKMEVELGKLAEQKAKDPRVKKFGEMMIADHTKANAELSTLAASKQIVLPDTLGEKEQQDVEDLARKPEDKFDDAYISKMIADHKDVVKAFDDASRNLQDTDLKAFATEKLPTLEGHLGAIQRIQEAQRQMMNNSNKPGAIGK